MSFVTRAVFVLSISSALSTTALADDPKLISGTYVSGHNITEPRPAESTYFRTKEGGVVIIGDDAGYYLFLTLKEQPKSEMYVRVEYEDPLGGVAQTNDMVIDPNTGVLQFSSPDFVHGLKIYSDYSITVRLFAQKDSAEPIDSLVQKVRSYVDTTGAKAKLMRGMTAR